MAAWLYRAADAGLARRIAVSLGVSDPVAYVLARAFADEAELPVVVTEEELPEDFSDLPAAPRRERRRRPGDL